MRDGVQVAAYDGVAIISSKWRAGRVAFSRGSFAISIAHRSRYRIRETCESASRDPPITPDSLRFVYNGAS
jgi:hypothetical protein